MKKNEKQIHQLQDLLKNKELSSADLKMLFKLYNSEKGNAEIKDLLELAWNKFTPNKDTEVDSAKILASINRSIPQK